MDVFHLDAQVFSTMDSCSSKGAAWFIYLSKLFTQDDDLTQMALIKSLKGWTYCYPGECGFDGSPGIQSSVQNDDKFHSGLPCSGLKKKKKEQ